MCQVSVTIITIKPEREIKKKKRVKKTRITQKQSSGTRVQG